MTGASKRPTEMGGWRRLVARRRSRPGRGVSGARSSSLQRRRDVRVPFRERGRTAFDAHSSAGLLQADERFLTRTNNPDCVLGFASPMSWRS